MKNQWTFLKCLSSCCSYLVKYKNVENNKITLILIATMHFRRWILKFRIKSPDFCSQEGSYASANKRLYHSLASLAGPAILDEPEVILVSLFWNPFNTLGRCTAEDSCSTNVCLPLQQSPKVTCQDVQSTGGSLKIFPAGVGKVLHHSVNLFCTLGFEPVVIFSNFETD